MIGLRRGGEKSLGMIAEKRKETKKMRKQKLMRARRGLLDRRSGVLILDRRRRAFGGNFRARVRICEI